MIARYDAVVIGAGAMGSAAAWWLARRGRRVALVEQFEQGTPGAAATAASRIFRYAYADPALVSAGHRGPAALGPSWRTTPARP